MRGPEATQSCQTTSNAQVTSADTPEH